MLCHSTIVWPPPVPVLPTTTRPVARCNLSGRPGFLSDQGLGGALIERNTLDVVADPRPTRLALLDSHELFRESLGHLLAAEPDLEVVGQCSTSAEALELLSCTSVDLVLLELSIGTERGDEFISAARRAGYEGKFLLVTAGIDPARSAAALKLGASGVFLKCNSSSRLMQAIRLIAIGETSVDRRVIQLIADRYPEPDNRCPGSLTWLTEREQTVLKFVADGLTNKNIGRQIGVSESAIKATLQQLFDKAGVRTRSQLVRAAFDGSLGSAGLVP